MSQELLQTLCKSLCFFAISPHAAHNVRLHRYTKHCSFRPILIGYYSYILNIMSTIPLLMDLANKINLGSNTNNGRVDSCNRKTAKAIERW